jgi:(2Fe-2S) ferredoxin
MRCRTTEVRDRDGAVYLLVCTTDRDGAACCGSVDGTAVMTTAQEWLAERDALWSVVVPIEASCLALCGEEGTAVGVLPHEEWFSGVVPADVPELLADVFGAGAEQLEGARRPD